MEMQCNKDILLEGDRYYWKLIKQVPIGWTEFKNEFQLHNKPWKILAFVKENFQIYVYCPIDEHLFDVQAGIVGDDQKELVVLNAINYENRRGMFHVKDLIRRSEVESILFTNKVSYVFVEIKRKDVSVQKMKKCTQNIETDYEKLFLTGRNSDVSIEVKDRKFNCHKCILGARSPVFSTMMKYDMKENAHGIVTINDSEPGIFHDFLLYLYTGSKKHLNWKDVTDMYKLANKYGVSDLKSLCAEHIKENITIENFCEFFLLFQLYNDSELIDTTIEFFLKNSKDIVESQNWMALLCDNPIESNVLIKALADRLFMDCKSQ